MIPGLRFWPDSASSVSGEINLFFIVMLVLCGTVAVAIAAFIVYCGVRYRRRHANDMGAQVRNNFPVEFAWTVIPFILFMCMFAWGAKLYFDVERPPADAIEMFAVGKQWMWKIQHPEGQREINTLHIPVGRPVRLTMTSEDVIHSFFVPAFRTKQDVVPGRYTTTWFQATKPGKYHLFCAEYCGTNHSQMIGWVYALDPQQYQQWLQQGGAEGSLASSGEKLFHQFACANCHHFDGHGPGPDLRGLYGNQVQLSDDSIVPASDAYIRRKLMDPRATTVKGFDKTVMPDFSHLINEEEAIQLIAYIRSLGPQATQPSSSGSVPRSYGSQPGISYPGAGPIVNQTPGMK